MPIGLPLMTYALYFWCNNEDGGTCAITSIPELPTLSSLYTHEALLVVFAWFIFQAILYIALPGPVSLGLNSSCLQS